MAKARALAIILTLGLVASTPATAAPNIFFQHDISGDFVYPGSILAVDFDQDADTDLLVTGSSLYGASGTRWLENDGHGNFTSHDITVEKFVSHLSVAQMDLDGDLDLVAGWGSYGWGFTWWENNGASFIRHDVDPPVGDYEFDTIDTFPGDIDGDGDIDVAAAGGQNKGNSFCWWENQGASWVRHIFTGSRIASKGIRLVDLDGDGDQDILLFFLVNTPDPDTPGAIVWWENGIGNTFTEHYIGVSGLVKDAFPVDLDGDGDIDLLTADGYNVGFQWWENDGSMNFTPHTIKGGAVLTTSIGAADLDNDGDLDVFGTDPGNWDVLWFENDGSQNFTERPVADGTLNNSWSIQAADFNGDGNTDLAAVSDVTSKILWWKNELPANTSFETGPRIPPPWLGRKLALADGQNGAFRHSGLYAFKFSGSPAAKSLFQSLNISGQVGDSFTLGGWSKSKGALAAGGAYSLEAKVFHTDGTARNYKAFFTKASHPWQYREKVFSPAKNYSRIVVSLRYANQAGRAWFDDIRLRPH